jgi:hypothetical protein
MAKTSAEVDATRKKGGRPRVRWMGGLEEVTAERGVVEGQ